MLSSKKDWFLLIGIGVLSPSQLKAMERKSFYASHLLLVSVSRLVPSD